MQEQTISDNNKTEEPSATPQATAIVAAISGARTLKLHGFASTHKSAWKFPHVAFVHPQAAPGVVAASIQKSGRYQRILIPVFGICCFALGLSMSFAFSLLSGAN